MAMDRADTVSKKVLDARRLIAEQSLCTLPRQSIRMKIDCACQTPLQEKASSKEKAAAITVTPKTVSAKQAIAMHSTNTDLEARAVDLRRKYEDLSNKARKKDSMIQALEADKQKLRQTVEKLAEHSICG
jgi:hypothetical protein